MRWFIEKDEELGLGTRPVTGPATATATGPIAVAIIVELIGM